MVTLNITSITDADILQDLVEFMEGRKQCYAKDDSYESYIRHKEIKDLLTYIELMLMNLRKDESNDKTGNS